MPPSTSTITDAYYLVPKAISKTQLPTFVTPAMLAAPSATDLPLLNARHAGQPIFQTLSPHFTKKSTKTNAVRFVPLANSSVALNLIVVLCVILVVEAAMDYRLTAL